MPQLELCPREDQQVARIVRADRGRVSRERLEDPQHVAHADVAERHDLHRETGRQGALQIAELRRHVAANGGSLRDYFVEATIFHHRCAVHAEQRFERCDERFAGYARARPDRHLSADGGIDRVALVQNVTQDIAHDFAQIRALEIEHDARTGDLRLWRSERQSATRRLASYQNA